MRRIIFGLLVFWMIFALAPVYAQQGMTYYVNVKAAKVRAEPKATAKILTTLGRGKSMTVLEVVVGETVSNVSTWYKVNIGGKDGYILSSLLTNRAPAAATPKPPNNNSQSASPTSAPVSVVPPAAASGVSCGGARVCGDMSSCAQAYACLNAGNTKLDRDKDGVPCESICPGG